MKKPVDWDELYPGRFIKPGELKGKKVTLTISAVDIDELESEKGKKVKGVISFNETPRQFALNKTNGICLKAMFGRKVQGWVGKKVTLFPDKWNGDDAIRVWGSPDIDTETPVEIKFPQRKTYTMTMHPVSLRKTQSAPADEERDAIAENS